MKQLLTKVFGDGNSRQLKKLEKVADQIEELEPQMQQLSDYAVIRKKRMSLKNDIKMASHWMTCCRKRMRLCVKLRNVC